MPVAVSYSGNFQCQWQFLIAALHLQSSGDVSTGKQAWTLIPYPILPPSLISHTVSVDIKHHERSEEIQPSELRGCVNREVGLDSHPIIMAYPILPPSMLSHTVSVEVKHHERQKERSSVSRGALRAR